ncbi:MAG: VOC family protein [Phycisphaerales bacterium JB040]
MATLDNGFRVRHLDHVALAVRDLDRAKAFYERVLGLRETFPGHWDGSPVLMLSGKPGRGTGVALYPEDAEEVAGNGSGGMIAPPDEDRHFAFRVPIEEFEPACKHLKQQGLVHEVRNHGVSVSVYFEDPDDNRIEITAYRDPA